MVDCSWYTSFMLFGGGSFLKIFCKSQSCLLSLQRNSNLFCTNLKISNSQDYAGTKFSRKFPNRNLFNYFDKSLQQSSTTSETRNIASQLSKILNPPFWSVLYSAQATAFQMIGNFKKPSLYLVDPFVSDIARLNSGTNSISFPSKWGQPVWHWSQQLLVWGRQKTKCNITSNLCFFFQGKRKMILDCIMSTEKCRTQLLSSSITWYQGTLTHSFAQQSM